MPTSISHPWFHVTLSSLDYRVPVSVHITKLAKLSKWDEPYHPLLETVKCSSRRRPHCTFTTAWMRPARCWKPTASPKGSAPRSAAQPTSPAGTSRPPHGGHAPSPPAPSEAPRLGSHRQSCDSLSCSHLRRQNPPARQAEGEPPSLRHRSPPGSLHQRTRPHCPHSLLQDGSPPWLPRFPVVLWPRHLLLLKSPFQAPA